MIFQHKVSGAPPTLAIVAGGSGVAEGVPFAFDGPRFGTHEANGKRAASLHIYRSGIQGVPDIRNGQIEEILTE